MNMAYLHGRYRILPWYRHVLLLDEVSHCALSPICLEAARHGRSAIAKWRPPRPPGELARILRKLRAVESREGSRGLERILERLFDELAGKGRVLARLCR